MQKFNLHIAQSQSASKSCYSYYSMIYYPSIYQS